MDPRYKSGNALHAEILEEYLWYHGMLEREDITVLLRNDGDFLVRSSDNLAKKVISVMWKDAIRHVPIIKDNTGRFTIGGVHNARKHRNIGDLIIYYTTQRITVSAKSGAILKFAVKRRPLKIERRYLELGQKLGEGYFAVVLEARLQVPGPMTKEKTRATQMVRVAVKQLKQPGAVAEKEFMDEAEMLRRLRHDNVVGIYGVITERPQLIILDMCEYGQVDLYLRKRQVLMEEKVRFCLEVARGMEYLAAEGVVHRDLAARNVLLDATRTCKINDFGLSREENYEAVTQGRKLAIRWLPPEAFRGRKKIFTEASDVWSFGIYAWEVFSGGKEPWAGLKNPEVRDKIKAAKHLETPAGTPEEAAEVMHSCWEKNEHARPSFAGLHSQLQVVYNSITTTP